MNTMISMHIIGRAWVVIAAAVVVPFVALTAGGCGGAATAAGSTTNGLDHKTATEVARDAAATLGATKSVQIVMTAPGGNAGLTQVDLQIQGGSRTLTVVDNGIVKAEFTVVGQYSYVKITPTALKMLGGLPVAKSVFGRWVRIPAQRLDPRGFARVSLASLAALLTNGHFEPGVRQATLNGRKVVVVTDQRNGAKLYVANTGPAYPLLIEESDGQRISLSDYGANFHITAPTGAVMPAR